MSSSRRVPAFQLIDGVRRWPYLDPAVARQAAKFEPQDGDVVLVTYPKCGTQWVTQIVDLIRHRGESASSYEELAGRAPSLENYGVGALKDLQSPRFMKSHFQLLRDIFNPRAKYVYVARNPWDCCVSYFHNCRYLAFFKFEGGTFDDFFEAFLAGELGNGDYFEHVLHGYARRNEPNVFFFTYEALKADTAGTILKLAYFLGNEYGMVLEQDQDILGNVLDRSSLEFMGRVLEPRASDIATIIARHKHIKSATSLTPGKMAPPTFKMIRKGQVNAWREHFTPEQAQRLRDKLQNVAPELIGLWDTAATL